jgi:DNA-directed RNA polymerase subunit M/transcription elongation factor TFIIS
MSAKAGKGEFLRLAEQLYDEITRSKDGETFDEIEESAVEMGRRISALLMKARLEVEAGPEKGKVVECPKCGKKMRIQDEAAGRRLQTTCSDLEYERRYCVCDSCGFSFSPSGQ